MARYLVMSDLASSANELIEMVKVHEDRWNESVRERGVSGLVKEQMARFSEETKTHYEKEHTAKELAAMYLYIYNLVRNDK